MCSSLGAAPATSQCYFGLQFCLEDLLGCSVDPVTDKALRPELLPYIEREGGKRAWCSYLEDRSPSPNR